PYRSEREGTAVTLLRVLHRISTDRPRSARLGGQEHQHQGFRAGVRPGGRGRERNGRGSFTLSRQARNLAAEDAPARGGCPGGSLTSRDAPCPAHRRAERLKDG